jgi:hypothetical protein
MCGLGRSQNRVGIKCVTCQAGLTDKTLSLYIEKKIFIKTLLQLQFEPLKKDNVRGIQLIRPVPVLVMFFV